MKKKFGVGITLSCLFCILLYSTVLASYAATVDSDESLPMEEIEGANNLGGKENLENIESVENPVSKEKESIDAEDKELKDTEAVTDPPNEDNKEMSTQNKSLMNRSLVNLSLFNNTSLHASLDKRNLNLSFVGTGIKVDLLGGLLDMPLLNLPILGDIIDLLGSILDELTGGSNMQINFFLPDDIDVEALNLETDISVSFSGNSVDFETIDDDITLVKGDFNNISFNVPKRILGIAIDEQTYQMSITLDEPIANTEGEIQVGAVASDGALIDIDLFSNSEYKTVTIPVPTPPTSPTLLPIYNNTMVIRGTLPEDFQSNSTVNILLPNGTSHKASLNSKGFILLLQQTLTEGAIVEATVTTADGLVSQPSTVTVQLAPTPIEIESGPLDFGTVTIGSDVPYKFLEKPLEIKVHDTRGTNENWELQASINQPLTTKSGHTLPNALGFFEKEKFTSFTTNEEGKGDAITIKTGTTQSDDPVTFRWDPKQKEGPAIKIDHSAVYAESYSTEITWTLVDSVQ